MSCSGWRIFSKRLFPATLYHTASPICWSAHRIDAAKMSSTYLVATFRGGSVVVPEMVQSFDARKKLTTAIRNNERLCTSSPRRCSLLEAKKVCLQPCFCWYNATCSLAVQWGCCLGCSDVTTDDGGEEMRSLNFGKRRKTDCSRKHSS